MVTNIKKKADETKEAKIIEAQKRIYFPIPPPTNFRDLIIPELNIILGVISSDVKAKSGTFGKRLLHQDSIAFIEKYDRKRVGEVVNHLAAEVGSVKGRFLLLRLFSRNQIFNLIKELSGLSKYSYIYYIIGKYDLKQYQAQYELIHHQIYYLAQALTVLLEPKLLGLVTTNPPVGVLNNLVEEQAIIPRDYQDYINKAIEKLTSLLKK